MKTQYILKSHNGIAPFYLNGIFPYAISENKQSATRFNSELLALETALIVSREYFADFRVEEIAEPAAITPATSEPTSDEPKTVLGRVLIGDHSDLLDTLADDSGTIDPTIFYALPLVVLFVALRSAWNTLTRRTF